MMKKYIILLITMLLIIPVACNQKTETIVIDQEISKEKVLTEYEIVEKFESERYKLSTLRGPFDNYKVLVDEYCLSLDSNEMKAYDMSFKGVDEDALKGKHFVGLTLEESRDRLIEIGVDLDWLDNFMKHYGKPNHRIYISEIIPGYYEYESSIVVKHEVDLEAELFGDAYTRYRVRRYKFKDLDGKKKLVHISDGFGFIYYKEPSLNNQSLEDMMLEFETRMFADGQVSYVKIIDLNSIDQ